MSISVEDSILNVIRERHSIRKYDPNFKMSRKEIEEILEVAITAPSSSNLQPWRFIVIDDVKTKKELRIIANNQEQVETSSAIIAVLGDKEMYHNVEKVYRSNFEAGYMSEESMERMITNSMNYYQNAPEDIRKNIAHFDAGLVTMQIMLIAKAKGFDTVPMGGFNKEKFIERFNIDNRFMPVLLLAVGKAAAPAFNTTRIPLKDILEYKN